MAPKDDQFAIPIETVIATCLPYLARPERQRCLMLPSILFDNLRVKRC